MAVEFDAGPPAGLAQHFSQLPSYAPHKRARLQHRPAADRDGAEEEHQRGRAEQVAVDHRRAGGALEDERADQCEQRGSRHERPARSQPDREPAPGERAEDHQQLVDAHAERPHRRDDVREPLRAFEFLCQACRRVERVQRVAGHDEIHEQPAQWRDRRQREQPDAPSE